MDVERLRVADVVRAPDAVDQHLAREDEARVREQQLEQLELLARSCTSVAPHVAAARVGLEADAARLDDRAAVELGSAETRRRCTARMRATSSRSR